MATHVQAEPPVVQAANLGRQASRSVSVSQRLVQLTDEGVIM